jgi:hypothetical protein
MKTLAMGSLLFAVPLRGNGLLLFSLAGLFLLGAICQGVVVSIVTKNQLLSSQISIILSYLPTSFYPVSSTRLPICPSGSRSSPMPIRYAIFLLSYARLANDTFFIFKFPLHQIIVIIISQEEGLIQRFPNILVVGGMNVVMFRFHLEYTLF